MCFLRNREHIWLDIPQYYLIPDCLYNFDIIVNSTDGKFVSKRDFIIKAQPIPLIDLEITVDRFGPLYPQERRKISVNTVSYIYRFQYPKFPNNC